MYENEQKIETGYQIGCISTPRDHVTIGENIARQIKAHVEAIERLKTTETNLAKANLLELKISELRDAMNY
jgi:hypothetical protein